MARPYSMDLRERAMARLDAGESNAEVAEILQVALSSVIKWAQRRKRTGSVQPGQMGGHRAPSIAGEHRLFVLTEVEKTPHVTLARLVSLLKERDLEVHPATVGRFLHREGKSFKKNALSRRTIAP